MFSKYTVVDNLYMVKVCKEAKSMIAKKRKLPIYLLQLEALLRRLPEHHLKREEVAEDVKKQKAGYKGEQSVDYQLTFLPAEKYMIFHDVRLFDRSHYFQLDTLILTSKFLLFLEVKNIFGTLIFDSEFHQLIRVADEKTEGFPDPILQMDRQKRQLRKWLQLNVPIESLAVISHHRTIVRKAGDADLAGKMIHSANLLNKMRELEERYPEDVLSECELCQLAERIHDGCVPLYVNVLKKYGITMNELQKGVQCPECFRGMERIFANWKCPYCKFVSKNAHEQAMKDYALLIRKTATNKEMKGFLNIASSDITKKLLMKVGFPYSGNTKSRKYELSFEELK